MLTRSRCPALLLPLLLAPVTAAASNAYVLAPGDTVVGQIETAHVIGDERPVDVARRRGLGHAELKLINPALDVWLPGNPDEIVLPLEFVLPNAPHRGIVLNVPEMRLYYFRTDWRTGTTEVLTYPIGIGREGWGTPHALTRVASKTRDPVWHPPESIRAEHAAAGDPLPERVGPGPDNPMGTHALRLALPMYALHGTNKPWGVGMRVSHGCIRLYNEHIAELFDAVPVGTPVNIVNQPYKVGVRGGRLFLEAHPSLDEDQDHFEDNMTSVVKALVAMTEEGGYEVDWALARQIVRQARGVPIEIGRLKTREPATVTAAAGPVLPVMSRPAAAGSAASAGPGMNLKLDPRPPRESR
jgi:L,D-transpeptidase ErfK/SrfK